MMTTTRRRTSDEIAHDFIHGPKARPKEPRPLRQDQHMMNAIRELFGAGPLYFSGDASHECDAQRFYQETPRLPFGKAKSKLGSSV